ncbi:hypothetical protein DK750_24080 [Salmonella enterica subsp. enterica serovar Rovaniemi]|nr:hypothetical protein [Salmonella enterica subsp. enterica serovar Rovaniemi]
MSNIDKQALRETAVLAGRLKIDRLKICGSTVLALLDELEAAESKCRELAAENSALKNPDNWLSQSDYGYEAAEVATQNGATDDESLRAGMIAIINRIETPATETILAGVRSEVIEWLDAEISAIDPVYRGDPSYEHDAYWMKGKVRDLIQKSRESFAAQLRQGAAK